MIQISTIKHQDPTSHTILHSHKLSPNPEVTIFLLIEGERQNIISIIEEQFLENISWLNWDKSDFHTDLSYVTEKYNHFLQNIESDDRRGISILIAVLSGNNLAISTIGKNSAVLIENTGTITSIIQKTGSTEEFEYIAEWEILPENAIYLSNKNLEEVFWSDILLEINSFKNDEWENICENLGKREIQDHIHIYRILRTSPEKKTESRRIKQSDIIVNEFKNTLSTITRSEWHKKYASLLKKTMDQKYFQYVFLLVWVFILFWLTYSIFWSLFWIMSEPKLDIKNQILQAQSLIEQSQKLTNNPTAFNKNIGEAENILLELRNDKSYTTDIQNLLSRIEAMKKEVNDIQTVNLSKYESIIKFNPIDISPLWVFEYNKKLTLIGKEGAILNYARGETLTKPTPYPTGEVGIQFDTADDGSLFILTENSRILSQKRNDITYVTVTGQNGWENSKNIKTFNGNIYLLWKDVGQIYKHKPGINGFSAKSESLTKTQSGIVDIGIDGWFFILYNDGKIGRYIPTKSPDIKNITLNKIPGVYDIGRFTPTEFFSRSNLSYIYILSGNKIWIFQPDSKRFQDISALNYIAQIELQTQEEIRHIFIPRDGTIYVTTNLGIYDVQYEIANNKLLLR
jgi:hypothetical protein